MATANAMMATPPALHAPGLMGEAISEQGGRHRRTPKARRRAKVFAVTARGATGRGSKSNLSTRVRGTRSPRRPLRRARWRPKTAGDTGTTPRKNGGGTTQRRVRKGIDFGSSPVAPHDLKKAEPGKAAESKRMPEEVQKGRVKCSDPRRTRGHVTPARGKPDFLVWMKPGRSVQWMRQRVTKACGDAFKTVKESVQPNGCARFEVHLKAVGKSGKHRRLL